MLLSLSSLLPTTPLWPPSPQPLPPHTMPPPLFVMFACVSPSFFLFDKLNVYIDVIVVVTSVSVVGIVVLCVTTVAVDVVIISIVIMSVAVGVVIVYGVVVVVVVTFAGVVDGMSELFVVRAMVGVVVVIRVIGCVSMFDDKRVAAGCCWLLVLWLLLLLAVLLWVVVGVCVWVVVCVGVGVIVVDIVIVVIAVFVVC